MADIRYFNGETRIGIVEEIKVSEFDVLFPGQKAIAWSRGFRLIGLPMGRERTYDKAASKWSREGFMPVQRAIQRKSNPSNHKCGARCLNATGFLCECACGGKNHGGGNFACEGIAA